MGIAIYGLYYHAVALPFADFKIQPGEKPTV
jgi:hypothetical protein